MKRLLLGVLVGCATPPDYGTATADLAAAPVTPSDEINPRLLRRFHAVAASSVAPSPAALVALGRSLFFDARLSRRDNVSCNTCHPLGDHGVDHRRVSAGTDGMLGARNAPTVYNAASHIAQFWDGRAPTVEDQATQPILNPLEMAMPDGEAVVAALGTPDDVARFADAFPGDPRPITLAHIGVALGAFERGLVTTSRWDRYLAGDDRALTPAEKHGLRVFLNLGCVVCHTGPQVGGTMFERVGVVEPWPDQRDVGRAAITKLDSDRMVFKVPSLKNVAETAPYFHDGTSASLPQAIRMMGRYQLGLDLGDDEVAAIATWMGSMSGSPDADYIATPKR